MACSICGGRIGIPANIYLFSNSICTYPCVYYSLPIERKSVPKLFEKLSNFENGISILARNQSGCKHRTYFENIFHLRIEIIIISVIFDAKMQGYKKSCLYSKSELIKITRSPWVHIKNLSDLDIKSVVVIIFEVIILIAITFIPIIYFVDD